MPTEFISPSPRPFAPLPRLKPYLDGFIFWLCSQRKPIYQGCLPLRYNPPGIIGYIPERRKRTVAGHRAAAANAQNDVAAHTLPDRTLIHCTLIRKRNRAVTISCSSRLFPLRYPDTPQVVHLSNTIFPLSIQPVPLRVTKYIPEATFVP